MECKIDSDDRSKVISEISDCQSRIIQTFVPTILAVGLISIADKEHFALITLFASFAILFGTSLYIANLSYKIFRNAMFLKAVSDTANCEESNIIHWEKALSLFTQKAVPPKVIGYETKTISVIYMMFSIVFIVMFFPMSIYYSVGLGLILFFISYKIFTLPNKASEYYEAWVKVLDSYNK